jgi:8-oxo-dGTP pyrophosphatase MutT (NUDIX family)
MNISTTPHLGADGTTKTIRQIAALCWRMHKGHVEVLLITSRETGRWVIPKGWPMDGLSAAAAAAREAWEEAGVEGEISDIALGKYIYDKIMPSKVLCCSVDVFPLRVKELKSKFPEAKMRRRAWHRASEAAHMVAEPELHDLLTLVAEQPQVLKNPTASKGAGSSKGGNATPAA